MGGAVEICSFENDNISEGERSGKQKTKRTFPLFSPIIGIVLIFPNFELLISFRLEHCSMNSSSDGYILCNSAKLNR